MSPYIFYLIDDPAEPPEFVLEEFDSFAEAQLYASELLQDRGRYDRVEITLNGETVGSASRDSSSTHRRPQKWRPSPSRHAP